MMTYQGTTREDILKGALRSIRELRRLGSRKPVIYTAGPFRAANSYLIRRNIRVAEEWALAIWKAGGVAICPHLNTANFQGAAPDDTWLEGDQELILPCDALFLLPNWSSSSGTIAEKQFAEDWGIPVFAYSQFGKMLREFGLSR